MDEKEKPVSGNETALSTILQAFGAGVSERLKQIDDETHRAKIGDRIFKITSVFGVSGILPSRTTGEAVRIIGAVLEDLIPLIAEAQAPATVTGKPSTVVH